MFGTPMESPPNSQSSVRVGSVALKVVPGSVLKDKVIVRSVRVEAPEITYEAAKEARRGAAELQLILVEGYAG